VLKYEAEHRAALAGFALDLLSDKPFNIDGSYKFDRCIIKIRRQGEFLSGEGEAVVLGKNLSAHHRNDLWGFEVESKEEQSLLCSTRSYGLLTFSQRAAHILEYGLDGRISRYEALRVPESDG